MEKRYLNSRSTCHSTAEIIQRKSDTLSQLIDQKNIHCSDEKRNRRDCLTVLLKPAHMCAFKEHKPMASKAQCTTAKYCIKRHPVQKPSAMVDVQAYQDHPALYRIVSIRPLILPPPTHNIHTNNVHRVYTPFS